MVLKEDGTKWACQSCLKGHRVSGCNHTDRELILVPKKGRPVTQCQHCRQERKKRSAHVSCDCGLPEKPHHPKEKCIHLREAEDKAKAAGYHDEHDKDPAHLARIAEEQGCCCHHGGKCTCALLMKEPDDGSAVPHGPAVKPKLEKATSEGAITVFHNGHHKPVHRKNHAAHECGMPYKIPMPRHHTDQGVSTAARRSVDNLALDSNQPFQPSPFAPDNTGLFNAERRKSKSEQHSPKAPSFTEACNRLNDATIGNIDFSTLSQTTTNQSVQSTTTESFGFPSFEPMSGIADSSFDPWSAYPSADSTMPNNNPFGVWPTSNDNINLAQPALTAASSGTTSEIDEVPPMDDSFDLMMPSIQEDTSFGFQGVSSRTSPQVNRRSLPPDMFGNMDFGIPSLTNDWQAPLHDFSITNSGKNQPRQNRQATSLNEPWQVSDGRPLMNVPQRQLGGLPIASRPQSRSVGPANAPDDIISQLFPGIDPNASMFDANNSPQMSNTSIPKNASRYQASAPTSAPVDFGPMDETNNAFTSQPWSDGSLSIPSDMITSPYPLDQDFSNPDFTGNWTQ